MKTTGLKDNEGVEIIEGDVIGYAFLSNEVDVPKNGDFKSSHDELERVMNEYELRRETTDENEWDLFESTKNRLFESAFLKVAVFVCWDIEKAAFRLKEAPVNDYWNEYDDEPVWSDDYCYISDFENPKVIGNVHKNP